MSRLQTTFDCAICPQPSPHSTISIMLLASCGRAMVPLCPPVWAAPSLETYLRTLAFYGMIVPGAFTCTAGHQPFSFLTESYYCGCLQNLMGLGSFSILRFIPNLENSKCIFSRENTHTYMCAQIHTYLSVICLSIYLEDGLKWV